MILYTYCCKSCGHNWDKFFKMEDRDYPLSFPCPSCGDYEVFRAVGCAGFQLKGFCWSRDNYSRTLGDDPRGVFHKNSEEYEK